MKKEKIRVHHKLHDLKQKGRDLQNILVEYVRLKHEYSKAIRKASTDDFRTFSRAQGKEHVWSITNRLIKNSPAHRPPSTLKTTSSYTSSPEETAKELLKHFYPDDIEEGETDEQQQLRLRMSLRSSSDDEHDFTADEVMQALQTMCPDRAPGHDNLTSDIILRLATDHQKRKKHVIGVSLDIKAAFDNAWWPALF